MKSQKREKRTGKAGRSIVKQIETSRDSWQADRNDW